MVSKPLNMEANKGLPMTNANPNLLKRRSPDGTLIGFVDISKFPFVFYDKNMNLQTRHDKKVQP